MPWTGAGTGRARPLAAFMEDEMLQRVREGVSSYPFAAAMVRAPGVPSLPGQAFASHRIGLRWRQSFGRALRRIVRGIRHCVASARASTTSSLRHDTDAARTDAKAQTRPHGAFLRRME
jgi:hypothetical protein